MKDKIEKEIIVLVYLVIMKLVLQPVKNVLNFAMDVKAPQINVQNVINHHLEQEIIVEPALMVILIMAQKCNVSNVLHYAKLVRLNFALPVLILSIEKEVNVNVQMVGIVKEVQKIVYLAIPIAKLAQNLNIVHNVLLILIENQINAIVKKDFMILVKAFAKNVQVFAQLASLKH